MKEQKMDAELNRCETETDVQKPSKLSFKAPGKISNRCKKKLISSPAKPSSMPVQSQKDSRKFKLQLFPIDCEIKNILEQNDHNPYLELTLATNKKISSVVKHLTDKWMDSFSAIPGSIVLYPYNAKPHNLVGVLRWTSSDMHTTAADVYNAIGTPSVFRLRYGCFSNPEPSSNKRLLPRLEENFHLKRRVTETNLTSLPNINEVKRPVSPNEPSFDTDVGSQQNNISCKPAPFPSWLDSISNLSFSALLSEASPNLDTLNPSSQNKNLQNLQADAVTCDSFDAAIGALIAKQKPLNNNHMGPPNAANDASIWDGEETCHALCSKEISDLQTGITIETNNADNTEERKNQMMPPKEESNLLAKFDYSLPEPMGSYENVIPCLRPSGGGTNSIGFSGLLSTSLDAFQNFSVF